MTVSAAGGGEGERRGLRWLKRFKRRVRRARRMEWAIDQHQGFRLGYITALDDVERTGLRPIRDDAKREAADRALGRLVDRD